MKDYLLIFKTLLRTTFRRRLSDDKRNNKGLIAIFVGIGIVYLTFMAMICLTLAIVTKIFVEYNAIGTLVFIVYLSGMALVAVLGTISMLSYVYFNKDSAFLSSVPVKSGSVFLAKLSIVYLYEAVTSAAVLLPTLLTIGIAGRLDILFYIGILAAILFVPAIPMLIASLLAIPLMYVASFFRSRAMLSTIAFIIVFALIITAYYLMIGNLPSLLSPNLEDIQALFLSLHEAMKTAMYILLPLYGLISFGCGVPFYGLDGGLGRTVGLLSAIGSMALLVLIAYFISNAVYSRGVRAQLEGGNRSTAAKGAYVEDGVMKSLVKKEFKYLFRIQTFGFQCLSGIVLCPLLIVLMSVMYRSMPSEAGTPDYIFYVMLLTVGTALNITAASAFSREGANITLTKALPISAETIIRSKVFASLIISYIGFALGMIALLFVTTFSPIRFFGCMIFLACYNYAYTCACVKRDFKYAKLDWLSPNEAVKNNKSVTVTVLVGTGVSFGISILLIIISVLSGFIPAYAWLMETLLWLVLIGATIAIACLMHKKLYQNCEIALAKLNI